MTAYRETKVQFVKIKKLTVKTDNFHGRFLAYNLASFFYNNRKHGIEVFLDLQSNKKTSYPILEITTH